MAQDVCVIVGAEERAQSGVVVGILLRTVQRI
jgi:hypothetical protein